MPATAESPGSHVPLQEHPNGHFENGEEPEPQWEHREGSCRKWITVLALLFLSFSITVIIQAPLAPTLSQTLPLQERSLNMTAEEAGPSQCPDVILSVPSGGSQSSPLNTAANSLTMSKCITRTSSCKEAAVIMNGKSKLLNSSFSKQVYILERQFMVKEVSEVDAGYYKIIDDLSQKCVALIHLIVEDPALVTLFTSQAPLARELSPNTTTENDPVQTPRKRWTVGVPLTAVAVAAVMCMWWQRKKHRSTMETDGARETTSRAATETSCV